MLDVLFLVKREQQMRTHHVVEHVELVIRVFEVQLKAAILALIMFINLSQEELAQRLALIGRENQ